MKRKVFELIQHGHCEEFRGAFLASEGERRTTCIAKFLAEHDDPAARFDKRYSVYIYGIDEWYIRLENDEDETRTELDAHVIGDGKMWKTYADMNKAELLKVVDIVMKNGRAVVV